jgi:hypothetical protein
MKLRPKNWTKFQHYKHRTPPWIRLHRSLLDDRNWAKLNIASKALAPMLWLLASEATDGVFDASVDELVFRLRISTKEISEGLKPLIQSGFFEIAEGNASTLLAACLRDATTEKSRVEESRDRAEEETEQRPDDKRRAVSHKLSDAEWLAEIKQHYPGIMVDAELRKMEAWLSARPNKQKTRRFIVNWLNRVETPVSTDSTPRKADGSIDYYADAVAVFGADSVVKVS